MTFIFNVFLIRGASFQNCAATNKGTLVSKHALILRNIIYPWLTGQYLLPSKKKSFATHTQTQVGRAISPSSYAHELALMKLKLQTPTVYLVLSRPGFLVVFLLLNLQFYVYS
jgi:hypothetical protein